MIAHLAVRDDEPAEAADRATERLEPEAAVGLVSEDGLACVPAGCHVLKGVRDVDPQRPGHVCQGTAMQAASRR